MNPTETFEKEYPGLADAYKSIMKEQYTLLA